MTTQRIAELEAEVMRLREAAYQCQYWMHAEEKRLSLYEMLSDALSTPFTPAALNELIEKVEKRTIERCIGRVQGFHYLSANFKALEEELQSLPTGQISLEELL